MWKLCKECRSANRHCSKISELEKHNLILAHQRGLVYNEAEIKVELKLNISRISDPENAVASERVWHEIQNNGSSVFLHTLVYKDDDPKRPLDNVQAIAVQVSLRVICLCLHAD